MRSTFDDPSFISVSFKKAIECEAKKRGNCEPSLCSCDVSAKRRRNNVTVKCTSIKCLFRFFFVISRSLGMRQRRNDTNRRHKVWSLTWCCEDILQEYELWRQQAEGNGFLDSPPSKRHRLHLPRLLLHNSETNSSVIDQKARAAWMRRSIIHWVRVEWPCHASERQNGRLANKGKLFKGRKSSLTKSLS